MSKSVQYGFTLVELLVAITILAIIGGLGYGNYLTSQKKGRDAQRKSDLAQIRNALELYHNDKQVYPVSELFSSALVGLNGRIKGCGATGTSACVWGDKTNDGTFWDGKTVYLKPVPADVAQWRSYYYESDGRTYRIMAALDNPNDPDLAATSDVMCGSNICACGRVSCNYVVTNKVE